MLNFKSIINFIKSQFPKKEFIALHEPIFKKNEKKYLLDAIDSTFVSSVGPYVDRFETMIANVTNTRKGVAVVNGTAGLQVALRLIGVKEGDEVLTQALTFVATANAITYNGATPVFLDVDYDTMGLSPSALASFLNTYAERRDEVTINKVSGKRIAACVPMHTFGFMARIRDLIEICDEWGIPVVEDAAEALGSSYQGKPAGSFGKIGIFSFNGNKIVTSGGGGALVTNDENLGKKGKHLTTTAKVPHLWEYAHNEIGFNFRMPNLNAALACAQLEQLDEFIIRKAALFEAYRQFFEGSEYKLKAPPPNSTSNYWLNCLELPDRESRNAFLKATNDQGIMTRPIWQLMYRLPMYQYCQRDEQTIAELLENRIVNIPSNPINNE